MKNEVILRFNIRGFNDITHDDLTQFLDVQPIKVHAKGDKRNPKNPDSPLIKENLWVMGANCPEYSTFEEQMDSMLTVIENRHEQFAHICAKYDCEFSCALFVYADNEESTPWVHLDARYNKLIKAMDIEFDIDLYVWTSEES